MAAKKTTLKELGEMIERGFAAVAGVEDAFDRPRFRCAK